ncbi:hypothetical protein CVT26_012833 [Gymnopilus dilepis]|uniref:Uncharacterized protein n=1 Tax=Gymnopilus dilepis TaxID=231916 RepID=A0A409Y419_9AGAR|nr:hypothetical protein CVT26_012833 [Gymnopilus dilepis]
MSIDSLLQDFPELSKEAVENAVAESLHEMLNRTCENAHSIHEEDRKVQAEMSGQAYKPLLAEGASTLEYVPMQVFKDNIGTNGLDADKWRATIQAFATDKFEAYVSSLPDPAAAKPIAEAVERFKASLSSGVSALAGSDPLVVISDRMANRNLDGVSSSGDGETLPEPILALSKLASTVKDDVSLQGIILVPLAAILIPLIGTTAYLELVTLSSSRHGHWFRTVLQSDQAAFDAAVRDLKDRIDKETADLEKKDKDNRELRDKQRRKRDERKRKKDKKRKDDEEKAKRKDNCFGSVVAIVPLEGTSGDPRGYAIRIEAVKENLLGDDEVLQKLKKITVADNIVPTVGATIYCLEIYCHQVPSGVKAGVWVNLELNLKDATPATHEPVIPAEGDFKDGLCWVEVTSPYASFVKGSLSNFGKVDHGYKVTVDMSKIKLDIAKTALDKLRILFERYNPIRQTITNFLRLSGVIQKSSLSLDQYKTADHFVMANVGQGAAGWIGSMAQGWGIVSDYGFGKGDRDFTSMIDDLLYKTRNMPVILSHWDRDHYRIADSGRAKLVRGTDMCPTLRHWVVPDQPLTAKAYELACSIHADGLIECCTADEYGPAGGNWRILRCQSTDWDDKNNCGALALVIGLNSDDRPLLYPGDANYEYIHNINQLNGKLCYVIATHHGSEASLKVKYGGLGSSIPQSDPHAINPAVYFSFGKGNSYGHSVEKVLKLYKDHGYKTPYATAGLASDKDVLIACIGPNMQNMLPNARLIPGVPADVAVYHDMDSYFSFMEERFKASGITPQARQASSTPPVVADIITLDGNNKDALEPYAVRDEFQQVVKYRVLARKLIINNCPLFVKCESDAPIQVLLQCEDIELHASAGASPSAPESIPVVLFDVKSGDPWEGYADVAGDVMVGNEGYMGGFLDLRVVGNWLVRIADKDVYKSGEIEQQGLHLQVQYQGGRGGDGEKGARGGVGTNGSNGTNDECVVDSYFDPWSATTSYSYSVKAGAQATPGGNGGQGGQGGKGGSPSVFPVSQVMATQSKVPKQPQSGSSDPSFTVTLALLSFGAQGNGGPGGDGGRGGHGGVQGQRWKAKDKFFDPGFEELKDQSFKSAGDGSPGPQGFQGQAFEGPLPKYDDFQPKVVICATEEETHERFMEEEFI